MAKKSPALKEAAPKSTKKVLVGVVVSDKMQNTAVIEVEVWKTHRLLKKRYVRHNRFFAHNPENTYKMGDRVEISQTAPQSRHKHWLITHKIEQGSKGK